MLSKLRRLMGWRRGVPSDPHPVIFYHERISSENGFYTELDKYSHSYSWGVIQAGHLATKLEIQRISVLEFGVAGGNGLVALEAISKEVATHYGISIDVYGFDTGAGLPQPEDSLDLPDILCEGDFPMDIEALRRRLTDARLYLGLVGQTVQQFLASHPAPIGFISFDMDFYSSTMQGMKVLEAHEDFLLPRVYCFFDDIFACGDFNGERLAISNFNAAHRDRKISKIYGLQYFLPHGMVRQMTWDKYYMAYIFNHRLYTKNLVGRRRMDLEPGLPK